MQQTQLETNWVNLISLHKTLKPLDCPSPHAPKSPSKHNNLANEQLDKIRLLHHQIKRLQDQIHTLNKQKQLNKSQYSLFKHSNTIERVSTETQYQSFKELNYRSVQIQCELPSKQNQFQKTISKDKQTTKSQLRYNKGEVMPVSEFKLEEQQSHFHHHIDELTNEMMLLRHHFTNRYGNNSCGNNRQALENNKNQYLSNTQYEKHYDQNIHIKRQNQKLKSLIDEYKKTLQRMLMEISIIKNNLFSKLIPCQFCGLYQIVINFVGEL